MVNLAKLKERLESASRSLDGVMQRRMFGCDGFFAHGNIYGLIWKTGRIGLRLPDEGAFDALMKLAGSTPWKAGPMVMKHWVLVPEAMHDDAKALLAWTKRAHAMALNAPAATKGDRAKTGGARAKGTSRAEPGPDGGKGKSSARSSAMKAPKVTSSSERAGSSPAPRKTNAKAPSTRGSKRASANSGAAPRAAPRKATSTRGSRGR